MSRSESVERLGERGAELWSEVTEAHALDAVQETVLLEACRIVDRLEQLDKVLAGDGLVDRVALRVDQSASDGTVSVDLVVDGAVAEARQQANSLKLLLVSLRLPDEATGKRPQRRSARGSHVPASTLAKQHGFVSSIQAAKALKERGA